MTEQVTALVQQFLTSLHNCDTKSNFQQTYDEVSAVLNNFTKQLDIVDEKEPKAVKDEIRKYTAEQLKDLLSQSVFQYRAFSKPLGYAGDFETIRMVYDNNCTGSSVLGSCLSRWILEAPGAYAVRWRREYLASYIHEKQQLMSVACGPCAEMFDVVSKHPDAIYAFTCLDVDSKALAYVQEKAAEYPSSVFQCVQANVIRVISGKQKLDLPLGAYDTIYSAGLIDYFNDKLTVMFLDWLYDLLKVGGRIVIGNMKYHCVASYMNLVLDWQLVYRTDQDLISLVQQSKFGSKATVHIDRDPCDVQLFVIATKV
jgi:ubiquinone/menaquinone biosynthesis C-methylase UbiE